MRHTHRERERQRHRQKEKQIPCREPDARLDLRTPGSCPELEADAQPLSHPGASVSCFLEASCILGERGQSAESRMNCQIPENCRQGGSPQHSDGV